MADCARHDPGPATVPTDVPPYANGLARARRELIAGYVSPESAIALLALLAALDVACETGDGAHLIDRFRREMAEIPAARAALDEAAQTVAEGTR